MNSSGYIRGYMSKNMNADRFIEVVAGALKREFKEEEVNLKKFNNRFKISMGKYNLEMSNNLIDELKSPYGVDRYILEEFENQGFVFDSNRSQYIRYCFNDFSGASKTVNI